MKSEKVSHSIVEIDQDTKESPGDLRRLAVTQSNLFDYSIVLRSEEIYPFCFKKCSFADTCIKKMKNKGSPTCIESKKYSGLVLMDFSFAQGVFI